MTDKKMLPVGVDIFSKLILQGFYYVDKTGMIAELLQNWAEVNLFTRPRRFGKSLNMSMLQSFFEIGCDQTLFEGLKISEEKELCEKYMGQYPVISLSLKGVEGMSFASACTAFKSLIRWEASRFSFLSESPRLTEEEKAKLRAEGRKPAIRFNIAKAQKAFHETSMLTFDEAKSHLVFGYSFAKQLSNGSTAFTFCSDKFNFAPIIGQTSYLYRTGVESTPFEVFKLLGVGNSSHSGNYRFRNKILKTSRYKVEDMPVGGWDFPTSLIYPMLEGPNVKPFEFDCANNFHIIPYLPEESTKPLSLDYLLDNTEQLAVYFANHRKLLDMQSEKSKAMHQGDVFYALSKIGPYTFAPYLVAARDNSKFCATVVHPTETPWGERKQTICVKHTIIISQDVNKNFITEDEAHYINGILNSSIVVSYIHSTFKTNGFSLNKSKLFIPKFIDDNPLFQRIVSLSKEATAHSERRNEITNLLTEAYLDICFSLNPQLKTKAENL